MRPLPELIQEYRSVQTTCSYRELAEMERLLWEEVRMHPEVTGLDMERWFVKNFSDLVTNRDVRLRMALLAAGSDVDELWRRIHCKELAPSAALKLLYAAKVRSKSSMSPLAEELSRELERYDKLPFVSKTQDGYLYRKKGPKKTKRRKSTGTGEIPPEKKSYDAFFDDIKTRTERFLTAQLAHTDPAFIASLKQELIVMLRVVAVDFRRLMVNAVAADSRLALMPTDVVTRSALEEACVVLKMDPPEKGEPVDMVLAKRQKWRLANEYHPDKTHRDTNALFNSVLESFSVIEKYNAQRIGGLSA